MNLSSIGRHGLVSTIAVAIVLAGIGFFVSFAVPPVEIVSASPDPDNWTVNTQAGWENSSVRDNIYIHTDNGIGIGWFQGFDDNCEDNWDGYSTGYVTWNAAGYMEVSDGGAVNDNLTLPNDTDATFYLDLKPGTYFGIAGIRASGGFRENCIATVINNNGDDVRVRSFKNDGTATDQQVDKIINDQWYTFKMVIYDNIAKLYHPSDNSTPVTLEHADVLTGHNDLYLEARDAGGTFYIDNWWIIGGWSGGSWTSVSHDFGDNVNIDNITVVCSISSGENIAMTVENSHDNSTWDSFDNNLSTGTNTYTINKEGQFCKITFTFSTDNSTHSPSVDNFAVSYTPPVNIAPSVENLYITDTDNADDNTLLVDTPYKFWVEVRDNDTIADIDEITLKLYENSLGQGDNDSVDNHYTFRWTRENGFEEVGPGGIIELQSAWVDNAYYVSDARLPSQHRAFYVENRYWLFWGDYDNFKSYYSTSTDGTNWDSKTELGETVAGAYLDVTSDGENFHIVRGNAGRNIYYRCGTPLENGDINWIGDWDDTGGDGDDYKIIVDSSGYPWIGFVELNEDDPTIIKSSVDNGESWSTENTWELDNFGADIGSVFITPLQDDQVYATYSITSNVGNGSDNEIYGKLWNGSSWGGKETASTSYVSTNNYGMFGATSFENSVYAVFRSKDDDLIFIKRTWGSGWGSEETVRASSLDEDSCPSLIVDQSNGDAWVFWQESENIYYRKRSVGGTWGSITFWYTEGENLSAYPTIGTGYEPYDNKLLVYYVARSSSPYSIEFSYLGLNYDHLLATSSSAGSDSENVDNFVFVVQLDENADLGNWDAWVEVLDSDNEDNQEFLNRFEVVSAEENLEPTVIWSYYDSGGYAVDVGMSTDGGQMAGGTELSDTLYFWDNADNVPNWTYDFGEDSRGVDMSDDGKYIVASPFFKIYLFENTDNTVIWSYYTGGSPVVSISADGTRIVGAEGGDVWLWDNNDNTPIWSYKQGGFSRASVSPDGNYVIAAFENYIIKFTDNDNTPVWTYHTPYGVWAAQTSASENAAYCIATAGAGSQDPPEINWGYIYLFGNDNNPIWAYNLNTLPGTPNPLDITASGHRISARIGNNIAVFGNEDNTVLWSWDLGAAPWSSDIHDSGEFLAVGSGKFGPPEQGYFWFFSLGDNTLRNKYDLESLGWDLELSADATKSFASSDHTGKFFYFETDFSPPDAPTLTSPENDTTVYDATPTFQWTRGTGATTHRLLVDNDNDFSSPNENRSFVTEDSYTIADENALSQDNYYWKVVAINALGENESDNWTFEMIPFVEYDRPVSQAFSVSESEESGGEYGRSISAAFSLTATVGVSLEFAFVISQIFSMVASVGAVKSCSRNISQGFSMTEFVSANAHHRRDISQGFGLTGAVESRSSHGRPVQQGFSIGGEVGIEAEYSRAMSQEFTFTTSATGVKWQEQSLEQGFLLTESVVAGLERGASIDQTFSLSGEVISEAEFSRSITQGFVIAESIGVEGIYEFNISQDFSIGATVEALMEYSQGIAEGFSLTASLESEASHIRAISEEYAITGEVAIGTEISRGILQDFSMSDNVIAVPEQAEPQEYSRPVSQSFSIGVVVSRNIGAYKSITQDFSISASIQAVPEQAEPQEYEENISQGFSASASVAKVAELSHSISQEFALVADVGSLNSFLRVQQQIFSTATSMSEEITRIGGIAQEFLLGAMIDTKSNATSPLEQGFTLDTSTSISVQTPEPQEYEENIDQPFEITPPENEPEVTIYQWNLEQGFTATAEVSISVQRVYDVSVTVSPSTQSAYAAENIQYTVTVINQGALVDNYTLSYSQTRVWDTGLENTVFDNVAAGDNRTTVLWTVLGTSGINTITVTATSEGDNTISDNDSCEADVLEETTSPVGESDAALALAIMACGLAVVMPIAFYMMKKRKEEK